SKFSKLISIELDKPARIKPQFVINHYTGETEIAIQDEKNQFYLINSEGKILWKIQLPEAIIGDITQVDMLKNKKLQMAFTTLNKLYIIDRTGKNLKSYPKNLPSRATAGLSVFDYDNKRDYRFFIPTENKQINL
ncbi:MAG TPA: WD40 repeat domain-containing protein, partial [Candidatus Enterocola sp.]|nr:WD40 repeat domain-containing protein [Candidatus Enterocola sp.]